jgi:2-polyprenyl-3-methyl-5-hydroxy-6-metoxy-1,4-benzoquinol methylase
VNGSTCRFCGHLLTRTFVDLGLSPLANAFVKPEQLHQMETFYPLHVRVCDRCLLVQLDEFESPEHIFGEYLYFSSYSDLWLEHCRRFAVQMVGGLALTADSMVVEIASNDGYLLQYFRAVGIPVLGVEPASNVARVALEKGIPTEVAFFGTEVAERLRTRGGAADLIVANNVLAHVPRLNDFVRGLAILLKPTGVITIECPHLLTLVAGNQFDTIYHEHFSYFSLGVLERLFASHGLMVTDAEELPTHGGSLRVHVRHRVEGSVRTRAVDSLLDREHEAGLDTLDGYTTFSEKVVQTKCDVLSFFVDAWRSGKTVAGYGAPAKGNTLLNYCGIGPELLPFTVDRSPHKQGRYLPGTRIPIHSPAKLTEARPDYVFILPWNLKNEIVNQMDGVRAWGGQFVVPIPKVTIL